jgi:hypothetical protein
MVGIATPPKFSAVPDETRATVGVARLDTLNDPPCVSGLVLGAQKRIETGTNS